MLHYKIIHYLNTWCRLYYNVMCQKMQWISVQHEGCTAASAYSTDLCFLLLYYYSSHVAACALMCQNEGTRNETTCTCDCADGYSGDNCGSECIMCHIDSCSLLFMGYEQSLKHISMRICLLLHLQRL